MAKKIEEWIATDVAAVKDRGVKWLSEFYFFRDPIRPAYLDSSFFFSPADGVVLYQKKVGPNDCLVDIKGKAYSLRDAMRDPSLSKECLVIGIFMTFYDVHVNRVPYFGRLCYRELDAIDTYNYPMLDVEKRLVLDAHVAPNEAAYLHNNQRMLNRIYAPGLRQEYFVLQVADFDVDSITPFELKQNRPFQQNQRFSQIRYGSQVDLIVPVSNRFDFEFVLDSGVHVEAGIDPLIRITP